jgi:hypothetical protein
MSVTIQHLTVSYDYPEHFDENGRIPLVDWMMIFKQSAIG